MQPLLSLFITLALAGVIGVALHLLILWLGVGDLAALLIFGAPICLYTAYCTNRSSARMWRSALASYASFSGVVLSCAGLVYFIG
jgi:hypothetical protein